MCQKAQLRYKPQQTKPQDRNNAFNVHILLLLKPLFFIYIFEPKFIVNFKSKNVNSLANRVVQKILQSNRLVAQKIYLPTFFKALNNFQRFIVYINSA